jgi:hemerythrin-like metal-binding protein
MVFMQWAPEMSVGLSQLDEDHRYLIKVINDLAENSGKGGRVDLLRQSLRSLLRYAEFHFAREEGVMRACGYDALAAHQGEHRSFTDKMTALSHGFDEDPAAAAAKINDELLDYLKSWLIHHIMTIDMSYKPLVENNRKAEEAARRFKASETWWRG